MMTLDEADQILQDELSRIDTELFSDRNVEVVYNSSYGGQVAILSHIALDNAQRRKMDAMSQYCYNIRKCPGSPFIVTDKAFRLFQSHSMRTSFGSPIHRGEQLYGRAYYDNVDIGMEPIFLVFNENEISQALSVLERLEYLVVSFVDESCGYGDILNLRVGALPGVNVQGTFVSIHYPLYEILEYGEDPDVSWDIWEYL